MGIIDLIQRLFGSFDPMSYEAPDGIPSPDEPRTLEIYKFDTCPFCIRVMRVVDKTGVDVTYRDTRGDEAASDFLFKQTGRTTVPCMFIDGVPMHESADISKWLLAYHARAME